jgi:hypothetical protein
MDNAIVVIRVHTGLLQILMAPLGMVMAQLVLFVAKMNATLNQNKLVGDMCMSHTNRDY